MITSIITHVNIIYHKAAVTYQTMHIFLCAVGTQATLLTNECITTMALFAVDTVIDIHKTINAKIMFQTALFCKSSNVISSNYQADATLSARFIRAICTMAKKYLIN